MGRFIALTWGILCHCQGTMVKIDFPFQCLLNIISIISKEVLLSVPALYISYVYIRGGFVGYVMHKDKWDTSLETGSQLRRLEVVWIKKLYSKGMQSCIELQDKSLQSMGFQFPYKPSTRGQIYRSQSLHFNSNK